MTKVNETSLQRQRHAWIEHLRCSNIPSSRIARIAAQPLKTAAIAFLRQTGRQVPTAATTFWGDEFHGVLPEAVSSLVWRYRIYEQSTSLFLLEHLRKGSLFLDIGAHFGYFTLLASRLVGNEGRVLAVEAMPETFSYLTRNLAANNITNVIPLNVAAAASTQRLRFRDFGVVNSSLNSSGSVRGVLAGRDAPAVTIDVEARALDDIAEESQLGHIDVIKIDAESSEEGVLAGLSRTLSSERPPVVLVELGGGDHDEDSRARRIVEWMGQFGLIAHVQNENQFCPIIIEEHFPYANVIFATEAGLPLAKRGPATHLTADRFFA